MSDTNLILAPEVIQFEILSYLPTDDVIGKLKFISAKHGFRYLVDIELHYNLGLDKEAILSYVNKRYNFIMSSIVDFDSSSRISRSFITRGRGSSQDDPCYYKSSFMMLACQDHKCAIDSATLDQIGSLINMQAYVENNIPKIFVPEFDLLQIRKSRSSSRKRLVSSDISNLTDSLDALRFRCSDITMFPFILFGEFMVVVLITAKSNAYVLKCNRTNLIWQYTEIKVCLLYISNY